MNNGSKKTILLVDDHPAIIDFLVLILSTEYNIMVATSGKEAIIKAMQQPDLILLDIVMPDMDGYEVCRKIKNAPALSNIPIIFVTGMNEPEDEIKGLSIGAVDYFIKPMHAAITLARIKNHLELKEIRDELQETNRILKQQVRNELSKNKPT